MEIKSMLTVSRCLLFLVYYLSALPAVVFAQQPGEKGTVVKNTQASAALGQTWAVVIGISEYENIQRLNFADRDAQAFYQYLRTPQVNVPEKNIKLILNKEATSVSIFGALDWLLESVKENDRVIFYFSGHGDVEKKTIYQNGFLLASDSPVAAYMSKGTVSVKFLQDYLETYVVTNKAKQVLLIVDACRSGKLAGGMEGIRLTMQALGKSWNGQVTKILSAQEGELSLEDVKWGGGRGVFSYYLMKGIQGLANRNTDNIITAGELVAYLPFAVADETTSAQNPKIEGDPRTPLFTFDEVLLAQAKQNDLKTGPMMAVNKGTANVYNAAVNDDFTKYQNLVKKGWLLWGNSENDTSNSALHYYKKLINSPSAVDLRPTLISSFLAALQKNAQANLDQYLKGQSSEKIKERRGIMEITYAATLTDERHLLHNYVNARALFFQSLLTKDISKAILLLKKSLKYENDAPYVLNRIGLCYADLNLADSAVYYYNRTTALAPTWSYPYNNLGIQYWESGDYPKAILNCELAIKYAPANYSPYNTLGNVFYDQGKYDEALAHYKKSIQLGQKQISYPYNGAGNTYFDLGKMDSAKYYYQKAIEVDPNDDDPYNGLGMVYGAMKKIDSAKVYYRKAMSINSKGHHAVRNLVDILIQESKFEDAKKILIAKLPVVRGKADLYNTFGDLYDAQQNSDSALFYYKKAMSVEPKHINAISNVGYIFNKMAKTDSAIKYFKLAEITHPTDDYPVLRLARIYTGQGNVPLAITYYEKLIRLQPNNGSLYGTLAELQPDTVKRWAYYFKAFELGDGYSQEQVSQLLKHASQKLVVPMQYYLKFLEAESEFTDIDQTIFQIYIDNNDCSQALARFEKLLNKGGIKDIYDVPQPAGFSSVIYDRGKSYMKLIACLFKSDSKEDAIRVADQVLKTHYLKIKDLKGNPDLAGFVKTEAFEALIKKYPEQ